MTAKERQRRVSQAYRDRWFGSPRKGLGLGRGGIVRKEVRRKVFTMWDYKRMRKSEALAKELDREFR